MTKNGKPRLKKMRRFGSDLGLLSGIRPLDSKCKLQTRPGVHGAKRLRLSDYGVNLLSKQYVRFSYRILDKQLYRYHLEAVRQMRALRQQGKEAEYCLFILLESRLDVVVYRMGFATTIAGARQLVVHGKIFVDGVKQSKPRLALKPGSLVEVRVKGEAQQGLVRAALDLSKKQTEKQWVGIPVDQPKDDKIFQGTFIRTPKRDELPVDLINRESEVIQFYSK